MSTIDPGKKQQRHVNLKAGPTKLTSTVALGRRAPLDRVITLWAPDQKAPWLVRGTRAAAETIAFDVPDHLKGEWTVEVAGLVSTASRPLAVGARAMRKGATVVAAVPNVAPLPATEVAPLEDDLHVETGEIREVRLPLDVINRVLQGLLDKYQPSMVIDTRNCVVRYLDDGSLKEHKVAEPSQLTWKKGPFRAELSDIKTKSAAVSLQASTARYPHGFVKAVVTFEEDGTELIVSAFPDAEIRGLVLTVSLGLVAENDSVSYEDVEATIPIKLEFNVVPDWLLDGLIGYSSKVRRLIESKLVDLSETVRPMVQKEIDAALAKFIPNAAVKGVNVTADTLVVAYTEK
jgi:hypothetical protein